MQKTNFKKAKLTIKKIVKITTIIDKNSANIIITDNGGGIEDSIINKIFDPYFTTKHQSQGTGIGLYMTHEIISKHFHGKLLVSNTKFTHEGKSYKGASFRITLPLT